MSVAAYPIASDTATPADAPGDLSPATSQVRLICPPSVSAPAALETRMFHRRHICDTSETQMARTAATLPPLAGSGAPAQKSDDSEDCDVPAAPRAGGKEAGAMVDDETEEEELAGEAGEKAAVVRARAGNVADSVCDVSRVCL